MPTPNYEFIIDIEGATEEELDRGMKAALAVFAQAHTTPLEALLAVSKIEDFDLAGFDPTMAEATTAQDHDLADAWWKANAEAAKACCAGWPVVPQTANLECRSLDPEPEAFLREDGEGDLDFIRRVLEMSEAAGIASLSPVDCLRPG